MSRPQPDSYLITDLEINLNPRKSLAIIFSVFLFLVVPIVIIENIFNRPANSAGQVAGISTTTDTTSFIVLFGQRFDLNSQAGLLIIAATLLIGIAILLIIFLIIDSKRSRKISRLSKRY